MQEPTEQIGWLGYTSGHCSDYCKHGGRHQPRNHPNDYITGNLWCSGHAIRRKRWVFLITLMMITLMMLVMILGNTELLP